MQVLRLNISNICNFSCKYCHVFKISKNQLPMKVMDWETIDFSIVRYTEMMQSLGMNKLKLSIYGGEPLLNKKNLFKAIEKFGKRYNDVDIDWVVNTNGSLMTEQDADFFRKHNIDVHLSVDGWEKTHDKNRVDKLGKGTFDRVEKALELIKAKSLRAQINSFVFPENQDKLHELIEIAEHYGISRFYLDFFYANEQFGNMEVADRVFDFVRECQKQGFTSGGPWSKILINHINRNHEPSSAKSYSSNPLPHVKVYVNQRFRIYTPFRKEFPLSMLNLELLSIENQKLASERSRLGDKYCRYCFLGRACNASMIFHYCYHTGQMDGHRHFCHLAREVIKKLTRSKWIISS